jgi:hypothetical protein
MRFTEPQGHTEEPARPTSSIDPFICTTSIHSEVFHIWLHHIAGGGGEETLSS